jgi:prepilin-type N-terminal cleavage/methylation domain-containing protein
MNTANVSPERRSRRGFTLVEILIAVVILAILAAIAVPAFQPNVAAQLDAAGRITAADLAGVRQSAIANNSKYRVTFEPTENRYYLEHSGTNSALNTLPTTIYHDGANTATRQYFDLDGLPQLGAGVFLAKIQVLSSPPAETTTLEFGPLGSTTQAADTVIWLSCGAGDSLRYLPVQVNAVTGLAQAGELTAVAP